MATETLTAGPELDRAAALAMGYTFKTYPGPQAHVEHWSAPFETRWPKGFIGACRGFSTDPRHIEEMGEWLDSKLDTYGVLELAWNHVTEMWRAKHGWSDGQASQLVRAGGHDLPEVFSRLVVAVKEAGDG